MTTTAAAFSAAHPKNVGGQCTDDGGCGGGSSAVYRRCRFPPQTFVVFLCLCAFVRTSISHAEGREYYFDLLHPPSVNECLGLSLFRAVRRTRHVIVPPQHRRSDGDRNTISKSLLRNYYFFFVQYFLQKISLHFCPRVATVKLSSTYRPDTVADTRTPG